MEFWFRRHPHFYIKPTSLLGWLVVATYLALVYVTGRLVIGFSFESICAFFLIVCFYTVGLLFIFYAHNDRTY